MEQGEWEPIPSAGGGGYALTSSSRQLFGSRPANFTGLIVELLPDVAAAPPAVVYQFTLTADGGPINETHAPDERGVFVVTVGPDEWTGQPLSVYYNAEGKSAPNVAPTRNIRYTTTLFTGSEPDWTVRNLDP
ncbi:MAG TPA: hypothetical protein VM370_01800 [Candidatus Thermoplasmatota archaeon]|nr:hypothetical protein [Candidatus Thermoplasmatota archaeon]